MSHPNIKSLIWVGTSLKEVRDFHEAVKDDVGFGLYEANAD